MDIVTDEGKTLVEFTDEWYAFKTDVLSLCMNSIRECNGINILSESVDTASSCSASVVVKMNNRGFCSRCWAYHALHSQSFLSLSDSMEKECRDVLSWVSRRYGLLISPALTRHVSTSSGIHYFECSILSRRAWGNTLREDAATQEAGQGAVITPQTHMCLIQKVENKGWGSALGVDINLQHYASLQPDLLMLDKTVRLDGVDYRVVLLIPHLVRLSLEDDRVGEWMQGSGKTVLVDSLIEMLQVYHREDVYLNSIHPELMCVFAGDGGGLMCRAVNLMDVTQDSLAMSLLDSYAGDPFKHCLVKGGWSDPGVVKTFSKPVDLVHLSLDQQKNMETIHLKSHDYESAMYFIYRLLSKTSKAMHFAGLNKISLRDMQEELTTPGVSGVEKTERCARQLQHLAKYKVEVLKRLGVDYTNLPASELCKIDVFKQAIYNMC